MTTSTSVLARLGAPLLLATLAGCASAPQRMAPPDAPFGAAARLTLRSQIIDLAPAAPAVVAGLDGRAARSAYENYQESFKTPVPQAGALSIGVGR